MCIYMAYDSYMYLDPCTVLERKQQAAGKRNAKCGKCAHYQSIVIGDTTHHGCTLKRRNWQACTYFQPTDKSL